MVGWLGSSSRSSWEAGKSCNSTFSLGEKWFKQWFGWAQSRAAHFESHPNVDPESLDSIVHCVCLFASGTPIKIQKKEFDRSKLQKFFEDISVSKTNSHGAQKRWLQIATTSIFIEYSCHMVSTTNNFICHNTISTRNLDIGKKTSAPNFQPN